MSRHDDTITAGNHVIVGGEIGKVEKVEGDLLHVDFSGNSPIFGVCGHGVHLVDRHRENVTLFKK